MSCRSGQHVAWGAAVVHCQVCDFNGEADVELHTCVDTKYMTCPKCGHEWEGRHGPNDSE